MKWFCPYCKEQHDSRDQSLFPPGTFSDVSGEYIAKRIANWEEDEQPQTLYHVSPRHNREEIERGGLITKLSEGENWNRPEPGVYAWSEYPMADGYRIGNERETNQPFDVWEIHGHPHEWYWDDLVPNAWVTDEAIDPKNLSLREHTSKVAADIKDDAAIEALRRELRQKEFAHDPPWGEEGWDKGGCHFVTEALEGPGATRKAGYFIHPEKRPDGRHEVIDHYWLQTPEGIVDPTFDSIYPGHGSVGRFPPGHPMYANYQEYSMHDPSWHQRYFHPMFPEECDDCEPGEYIAKLAGWGGPSNYNERFESESPRQETAETTGNKEMWEPGEPGHFEYHCYKGHDSTDAQLWYRSHQPVTVLGLDPNSEEPIGNFVERTEGAMPLVYKVRFGDGHEGGVFEDELYSSPEHFHPGEGPPPDAHKYIAKTSMWENEDGEVQPEWEGQDLYHVAPTSERQRILQHGLHPSFPGENPRWEGVPEAHEAPTGIYTVDDPEHADDWHGGWRPSNDVWRIPADQIKAAQIDPEENSYSDEFNSYVIPHHIPAPELFKQGPEEREVEDQEPDIDQLEDEQAIPNQKRRQQMGIGLPDRVIGKIAAWQDWTQHIEPIAQAYEGLPLYDPQAATAWKELADNSMRRAQEIGQRLNVQVTDNPEPYGSPQEMFDDINRGRFQVSRANSEHPIWTPEQNVAFRTVHDVEGHHPTGGDFSWAGENQACGAHAATLSPLAQKALMTECLGQTGWAIHNGGFGPQKVGFMNVNPQTFSSAMPEGGFCHRHIRHGLYRLHTAKTSSPRQMAKFVYSPIENKLVMGEMGAEEGEKPTHFELAQANFPREGFSGLAFGHVAPDGFINTYGRPHISLGKGEMNPHEAQWLTEEALRRAIPHARFLHPEPQHNPNWSLQSDPEVIYTGEPPQLDNPEWDL